MSGFNLLQKEAPFSNSHEDATEVSRGPGVMRLPFPLLYGCDLYEVLLQ